MRSQGDELQSVTPDRDDAFVLWTQRFFVHRFSGDDAVMAGNGMIGLKILEGPSELDASSCLERRGDMCCGIASAVRALAAGVRVYVFEFPPPSRLRSKPAVRWRSAMPELRWTASALAWPAHRARPRDRRRAVTMAPRSLGRPVGERRPASFRAAISIRVVGQFRVDVGRGEVAFVAPI